MTSACQKGIFKKHNDGQSARVISQATYSGYYRDMWFVGTFCPPTKGYYQLIFDGSYSSYWEPTNSWYSFLGKGSHTQRTTDTYHLYDKTCYPYYIVQAVPTGNSHGSLYFREKGKNSQLMTSDFSFSCMQMLCFKGSHDPYCLKNRTRNIDILSRHNYIFSFGYFICYK